MRGGGEGDLGPPDIPDEALAGEREAGSPERRMVPPRVDDLHSDIELGVFDRGLTVGQLVLRQLEKNEIGLERTNSLLIEKTHHDDKQDEEILAIKEKWATIEKKYARLMNYVHWILGGLVLFCLEQLFVHSRWFK